MAAWTGREFLVFGGVQLDSSGNTRSLIDGAAYDPAANRWRTLPQVALSTGQVVGGMLGARLVVVSDEGAATYDPATDSWSTLPSAPVRRGGRVASVVGDRLVLIAFGDGAAGTVDGAILDGEDWQWSSLTVPLRPIDLGVEMRGTPDGVIIEDLGLIVDPETATWRDVEPCPAGSDGATWTGRYLLGVYAAYDPQADQCLALPQPPPRPAPFNGTSGREFATGVWTGSDYITWSGGTGLDNVWVPNDGVRFRPDSDAAQLTYAPLERLAFSAGGDRD